MTLSSAVCMELWHACARPSISLPKKGSSIVYFPLGRVERLSKHPVVAHDLPPHVFCRVIDVKLHADVANDEVYAQASLVPDQQINNVSLACSLHCGTKDIFHDAPVSYFHQWGAVVWPINWKHLQKGISVWLDVLLEALPWRITAIETDSQPLLQNPYLKTMKQFTALFEERGEAYAKADLRVSIEKTMAKLGLNDVCNITPTVTAIEVQSFITTLKALSRKDIYYGAYATSKQVIAVGDLCAICQEKMHAPVFLHCKHIFCEDYMFEWFIEKYGTHVMVGVKMGR